jgi:hypothetical protein
VPAVSFTHTVSEPLPADFGEPAASALSEQCQLSLR